MLERDTTENILSDLDFSCEAALEAAPRGITVKRSRSALGRAVHAALADLGLRAEHHGDVRFTVFRNVVDVHGTVLFCGTFAQIQDWLRGPKPGRLEQDRVAA